jgi:hypothetical protein
MKRPKEENDVVRQDSHQNPFEKAKDYHSLRIQGSPQSGKSKDNEDNKKQEKVVLILTIDIGTLFNSLSFFNSSLCFSYLFILIM